jgi:citrate lyase beta subunit
MVESGRGFAAIPALAAVRGVERFAIGTWDLLVDFGLLTLTDPDESELIWQLRGLLVLASRQAGVAAPIDGVYAQFDDDAGLEHACLRARQLGFAGKLIVHPRQAVIARRSFRPDPERIRFAREVLAAYAVAEREGSGVLRLRGQMIDRPMVEQARALLAKWGDDDSHIYLDRT